LGGRYSIQLLQFGGRCRVLGMLGDLSLEFGGGAGALSGGLEDQAEDEVVSAVVGTADDGLAGIFGRFGKLLQLELSQAPGRYIGRIGGVNADGALQIALRRGKLRRFVIGESEVVGGSARSQDCS
jgi:hypothetical protein